MVAEVKKQNADKAADDEVIEVEDEDGDGAENVAEDKDQEGGEAEAEGEEGDGDGEGEGEGEEDEEAFPECNEEGGEAGDGEDAEGGEGEGESGKDSKEEKAFDLDEVLKTKIKFKDDSEGFIFSRGPKYSDDKWPINCHVCRLGNLITTDQVRTHVKSRRHFANVKRKWPDPESFNTPFYQCMDKNLGLDKPIKIYPGETIDELTPELEDRIVKEEEFAVKKPSEDIIKELSDEPMHEYNKKLPLIGLCYMYKMKGNGGISYYCTLCNLKLKGQGFKHVTGANHQYKYIERHFPKFYSRVIERFRKEQRMSDFKKNVRNIFRKLYRKIENAKGFREITIVDDDDFFKNKKRYLLKTRFDTHYDENTILITEQEVDILIRKCVNRMEFIKPDLKTLDKNEKGNDSRARPPRRGPPPRSYNRDDDDDPAWERYEYIMQREIDQLNWEYQEYDRIPKKHPMYLKVEKSFFRGAGKDQPKLKILRREWMPHWRRRLRQFYERDLAKRKLRVKRELRLRTDVRTPSPIDTPRRRVPSRRTPSPMRYDRRYADRPNPRDNMMDSLPPAPSEPLGVISVLRLLTALEDKLGSLGPKAVQLMSKAVLAEKSNQNPNDLMMENEIYVFFVTAKEKLKGQLFANIVDQNMIGAVNRAIKDATTLLDMFEDYMRRTGKRPIGSAPTGNQFDNSIADASSSTNQYRSGGTQYTSDNNGSTNQFSSSGTAQYSSNQYQTGSGNGNLYSSGGGGSQFSSSGSGGTSGQFTSTSQYRGGGQGGIWQSGGGGDTFTAGSSFGGNSKPSGGYQSRGLSSSGGMSMGNRMY